MKRETVVPLVVVLFLVTVIIIQIVGSSAAEDRRQAERLQKEQTKLEMLRTINRKAEERRLDRMSPAERADELVKRELLNRD